MRLAAVGVTVPLFALLLPASLQGEPWEKEVEELVEFCQISSEEECIARLELLAASVSSGTEASVFAEGGAAYSQALGSAGVSGGLSWLLANQNPSGSWGTPWFDAFRPTTEFRDTAVVAEALTSGAGSPFADATAFLTSQSLGSIDRLGRVTRVRALAGESVVAETNQILAARSSTSGLPVSAPNYPNSGWGASADSEFAGESNALDTALALRALGPGGVSSPNVSYLLACQNIDGGFGVQPGRDSSLHLTLEAMLALMEYPGESGVTTAVSDAADYVATLQDAQGLIGEAGLSPTAYETALGALALDAASRTTEADLARSGLLAIQAANGSWNDDPYATGLAVIALPEPEGNVALVAGVGGLLGLWRCRRSGLRRVGG